MANTYPTTQFPLGSTEVKVLFNNASNFDEAMNSELPSFYDRFNKRRETWAGMQKMVADFLEAMGFEATHLVYVDGTPLTVLRPTQLIDRAGSVYKVKMPATFPVNLTGTWATDQLLLVDVGDASLRMALASSASDQGAYLVNGAIRALPSVTDLRAATVGGRVDGDLIELTGYYNDLPGVGGGLFRWDASSTSADNGFTVIKVTTLTNGRWIRVGSNDLNIGHAGARPGTDCAAALNATIAANLPINVPSGWQFRLSTSTVIPVTCSMNFAQGASLTIDNAVVLSALGPFSAPAQRVFYGSGIAIGIRDVVPEWWGASTAAAFDNLAAFNAAYNCIFVSAASYGGRQGIQLSDGDYEISAPWVIAPTANCGYDIRGTGVVFGGTRIKPAAGFPASPVVIINGTADTTQRVADFQFRDLGIEVPASNAAVAGVQLGNTSALIGLSGLQQNLIENVFVTFAGTVGTGKSGWIICHARLVTFSRCSVWMDQLTGANNTCLRFQIQGSFTGDLRFENCQFVPSTSAGNYCVRFEANGGAFGAGINQLAGIKFAGTDFYAADIKVYGIADLGSRLSDIWILPGCQFDGSSNHDIYLESKWSGGVGTPTLIDNIHIRPGFIFGGNLDPGKAQITLTSTGTGGSFREIYIQDNTIGSAVGPSILVADNGLGAIEGIKITGNTIRDSSSPDACIEIHGRRVTCSGNHADRFSTAVPQHLVRLAVGSTACIVKDNIGVGVTALATVVNDASAVLNIVSDNL